MHRIVAFLRSDGFARWGKIFLLTLAAIGVVFFAGTLTAPTILPVIERVTGYQVEQVKQRVVQPEVEKVVYKTRTIQQTRVLQPIVRTTTVQVRQADKTHRENVDVLESLPGATVPINSRRWNAISSGLCQYRIYQTDPLCVELRAAAAGTGEANVSGASPANTDPVKK